MLPLSGGPISDSTEKHSWEMGHELQTPGAEELYIKLYIFQLVFYLECKTWSVKYSPGWTRCTPNEKTLYRLIGFLKLWTSVMFVSRSCARERGHVKQSWLSEKLKLNSFWKYAYSLSGGELHENTDTTLMSASCLPVKCVCAVCVDFTKTAKCIGVSCQLFVFCSASDWHKNSPETAAVYLYVLRSRCIKTFASKSSLSIDFVCNRTASKICFKV